MSIRLPAFWAVIPAAGVGARMAADRPKQYLQLGGRTILEHSLGCFLDHPTVKGVVVRVAHDDPYWPTLACASDTRIQRVDGGEQRSDRLEESRVGNECVRPGRYRWCENHSKKERHNTCRTNKK